MLIIGFIPNVPLQIICKIRRRPVYHDVVAAYAVLQLSVTIVSGYREDRRNIIGQDGIFVWLNVCQGLFTRSEDVVAGEFNP